jgi:hypothetical protein
LLCTQSGFPRFNAGLAEFRLDLGERLQPVGGRAVLLAACAVFAGRVVHDVEEAEDIVEADGR